MFNTSREYFRTLMILHGAMCAGTVMCLGIMVLLRFSGAAVPDDAGLDHLLMPIAAMVVVGGCIASHFLYSMRLKPARSLPGLGEKLAAYRGLLLLRWALLEGPALFATVCFFLTGNQLLLAFAALPLLLLVLSRPTKERAATDLELNWEEKAILDDPESSIDAAAK